MDWAIWERMLRSAGTQYLALAVGLVSAIWFWKQAPRVCQCLLIAILLKIYYFVFDLLGISLIHKLLKDPSIPNWDFPDAVSIGLQLKLILLKVAPWALLIACVVMGRSTPPEEAPNEPN